ncbi:pyridoxamine 5'-phosphate oxidase family protein [uncultured Jatrophihabitans sp.]|uniref:pyridoxamine 5'-phosphate oxidase family protein n=1 Tax=uncultured Jatrophihabitans sp. TaxID=1610747 RepID=UPI0035C9F2E9
MFGTGTPTCVPQRDPLTVMQRTDGTDDLIEQRVDWFFAARSWRGTPTVMEPDKCAELEWFNLDQLPSPIPAYEHAVLRGVEAGRYLCSPILVSRPVLASESHARLGPMPITNPWLAGPAPEQALERGQLEERILNLLSTHNTAVIATVNSDGAPAATPVRYFHLGFEIFYTSWDASVKSRNLRRDSRVSAGIVAPLVGQASSRGAQLFGTARTLQRHDPDADAYWEAVRWQSDHVERGRSTDTPPEDPLTVITPTRIVYTEHWLRRSGYAPRQIWQTVDSQR